MLKLDLGCGVSKRAAGDDYIGIDINPSLEPDIVMDLDKESLVDKFGENSVDAISSCHFLEHSNNFLRLIEEMWKVSKPNALWRISVPPAWSEDGNPYHKTKFTKWTFRFFETSQRFFHPVWGIISRGTAHEMNPIKLYEVSQEIDERNIHLVLKVIK